jgi:hypothetical protein
MPRPLSRTRRNARRAKRATATPALDALLAAGTKAAKDSGRARVRSKLPPELQAPITTEIEQQLAVLIRQLGVDKVREALAPPVTGCKWNDWLCVSNAIDRLARRAERQPRSLKA